MLNGVKSWYKRMTTAFELSEAEGLRGLMGAWCHGLQALMFDIFWWIDSSALVVAADSDKTCSPSLLL